MMLLLLAGCAAAPVAPTTPYAELKERTRGFEGAAAHLAEDTDLKGLAVELKDLVREQQRVEQRLTRLQAQRRLDAACERVRSGEQGPFAAAHDLRSELDRVR